MASVDFIDYSKIILNNGYFSSSAGEGDKLSLRITKKYLQPFEKKIP